MPQEFCLLVNDCRVTKEFDGLIQTCGIKQKKLGVRFESEVRLAISLTLKKEEKDVTSICPFPSYKTEPLKNNIAGCVNTGITEQRRMQYTAE